MTKDEKLHYVYIKDMNKLLSKQLRTKNKGRKHLCLACLNCFTSERVLNDHQQLCLAVNGTQAAVYEEGIIRFKHFENLVRCPFRIYADTECFTKYTNFKIGDKTTVYQKHIPNTIGCELVCTDDRFSLPPKIFTGSNCIRKLIEWLIKTKKYCENILKEHF